LLFILGKSKRAGDAASPRLGLSEVRPPGVPQLCLAAQQFDNTMPLLICQWSEGNVFE
jgi:hypothetical protein